jgi:hypothetical protein
MLLIGSRLPAATHLLACRRAERISALTHSPSRWVGLTIERFLFLRYGGDIFVGEGFIPGLHDVCMIFERAD